MRRVILRITVVALALAAPARAQTPAELTQTNSYVAALQNRDGGFASAPGGASTLGSTSSAIRILKNTRGSIPDVLGCIKYVESCRDAESGGFAPAPGGKPDVHTTAVGLMAAAELKIASDRWNEAAIDYLSKHAKSFEEIRIAVAGLEAIKKSSAEFASWTKQVLADRNSDGTFGQGAKQARDTGGAAVALLRMNYELDKKEAVLAALRAAQHSDGAWSNGDADSDLEATYRIMRCFFMLKEKPDLDRLAGFIARCRQPDGSYSVKPGAPGSLGGTYFATTVGRWVKLLNGEPEFVETAGFLPLFNGHDLSGWEGDSTLWSAREGMLVGSSAGIKHNEFLAADGNYADFVLQLCFRLRDGQGNSGVQFRSVRVPGHEMSGYQADIGENYWGCLYDESRRNKILEQASDKAKNALHKTDWNHYVIRALGDRVRLSLNGATSVDYRETDSSMARDGRIAVQIHAGGPMEVRFKDILIQPVPRPDSHADSRSTGFHLRTVKSGAGERKYTVYLPKGYDDHKTWPVVLFLHGSGQRGEDGVACVQVGIGPAIALNPGSFPAIAVFPQARKTWEADSDDAKSALAALDDVLSTFKTDKSRVVLTGLSMGGGGSWSIAAANPERFAAVVPICARGKTDSVGQLKALPVWTIVGDADRDETVLGTRAMVAALREAGNRARETEYRGVGHNSWDRAYNDRELIAWMLAQARP